MLCVLKLPSLYDTKYIKLIKDMVVSLTIHWDTEHNSVCTLRTKTTYIDSNIYRNILYVFNIEIFNI